MLHPVRVVVTDASVLINFAWIGRFDLLGELDGLEFLVPQQVFAEVSYPAHKLLLRQAVDSGWLVVAEASTAELAEAARIVRTEFLDAGEAECLAMASVRGFLIACDETNSRFRRVQQKLLGVKRCLTTVDLIVACLDRELISINEADGFLAIWSAQRFRLPFASFAERWTPKDEPDGVAEGNLGEWPRLMAIYTF